MRRGPAHLTIVLGEPATTAALRCALEENGVEHAAVVAHVGSVRRSLVLGENEFVVMCMALDERTIARHGPVLRSLLADSGCFPTTLRTVGLLSDLGLTREAAELGCDVYVEDSAQAAKVIRLLESDWSAAGGDGAEPPRPVARPGRLRIQQGWMFGRPSLPKALATLVPQRHDSASRPIPPQPFESTVEGFGDPTGPH